MKPNRGATYVRISVWNGKAEMSFQQCVRLSKDCDYTSKVLFKDETPKVVDKYLDSGATEDLPWSHQYLSHRLRHLDSTAVGAIPFPRSMDSGLEEDDLPPFASLTTEEEWQRKAEHRPPGTYFVVANSASFADSEDYRNDPDSESQSTSAPREETYGHPSSEATSSSRTMQLPLVTSGSALGALELGRKRKPAENVSVDADTLILGTFDEGSRRASLRTRLEKMSAPLSPHLTTFTHSLRRLEVDSESSRHVLKAEDRLYEVSDTQFMNFYRSVVRVKMLHIQQDTAEDWLEREANHFLPVKDPFYLLLDTSARACC